MKLISLIVSPIAVTIIISLGVFFKRNKVSFQTFILWTLIWLVIALAFLFPSAVDGVSQIFGMNNRMFFVFTISIIILFVISCVNFTKHKQNELTLIKLIQQISLLASSLEEVRGEINRERSG